MDEVIGFDLCPFARRPTERDLVRLTTVPNQGDALVFSVLNEVVRLLESDPDELSTTLIVVPTLSDYGEFLDAVGLIEAVVEQQGGAPLVQILAFHPDAVFEGSDPQDPANAAARAPAPVIHLLRADEVQRAVSQHPDAAGLSERNAARLRSRAAAVEPSEG